ncbi:MAG: OmpA family protein [Comamonadaceae bacterium]|nr:MAG: OmpA family protein [Comamonadaceae bacterium]
MFSQNDDGQQAFALGLVFTVAALAVALVLGVGISRSRMPAPVTAGFPSAVPVAVLPAAVAVAVPAAPASATASPVTSPPPDPLPAAVPPPAIQSGVMVESGTVRFYFESGSAQLAGGAEAALAGVIASGKDGKTVVISGFHDASGSIAANAELARKRAAAVRDALLRAGVPAGRIVLEKPAQTEAGKDAQSRRVDITVQ